MPAKFNVGGSSGSSLIRIIRGTASVSVNTFVDITIPQVNMEKAEVRNLGTPNGGASIYQYFFVLINSTTLRYYAPQTSLLGAFEISEWS